jgi:hypothetical protein
MNDDDNMAEEERGASAEIQALLDSAMRVGWLLLACSMVLLYLSSGVISKEGGESVVPAFFLMGSRTCGIGSFLIGALAIFNRRWTTGLGLLFLSIALPLVAFHLHGTV